MLPRLAIVVGLCLTAVALPAVPVQADEEPPPPSITLAPSSGVVGTEVTVRGYNFEPDEWADIYYAGTWMTEAHTTGAETSFTATFFVPESYRGIHQVLAEVGDDTADAYFTVWPGLTVSPEEGPVGGTVIVTGRGFARDETGIELRYYLNGTYEAVADNITAGAAGGWEESFEIPPSTKGSHKIDARGDDSSLAAVRHTTFMVTPGIRTDELSGSPGESIAMTGSGFTANERNIRILFDGEAVVEDIWADDKGYWQEPFEVPERPGGNYSVTAEGDWTKEADLDEISFELRPGIVLYPDEGHVGMNLTVTGGGFAPNEGVVIMYEGHEEATATTDDKGSFEVTFPVPESRHGKRDVTAEDGQANEAAADFTMESHPPPTPELISPPDGGRAGFVGRVRPRFEWSEVEDPSGVYYNLQIATSANVTDTGEFVDPIVTKEGLVGANYTLEKPVSYGTYYWMVQAVDGAENESGWSEVYCFQAGLLPLWAFIVIMVLVVSGGGGAAYIHLKRKKLYD
ncbi:MAG: hypothetical protein R6V59_04560 [Dehalococcoidia bacterium]